MINECLVGQMLDLHEAFNGDLLEAIVLSEIAHNNPAGLAKSVGADALLVALIGGRPATTDYVPTNAF